MQSRRSILCVKCIVNCRIDALYVSKSQIKIKRLFSVNIIFLIFTKVKSGDGGLIVDELPHCDHINHTYIADFGIHYMDSKLLDTSFINSIEFTQ